MKNILYFIFISIVSVSVNAGTNTAQGYEVQYVRVDASGKGFVNFKKALYTTSTCANAGYENALAFDTNTAGGKSILSVVLTAQASNRTITASGTSSCNIYSGTIQDWGWGFMN